ncbi:DUF3348 family protein [Marinobacter salexigens]|uniref:DUF3348 domain-containing protein n=1 Tax=Marinobacter salexigens TaxID=1925763 RepID=A0ABS6A5Y3_9GAMM|nr:DUF3348 family protein [Marinobacter salexigens]MBU2873576.1 DUF3348 domain-containing protein [Marinobacter salexigens]
MTQIPSLSAGTSQQRLLQLLAQSGAPVTDGPLPCCGERLGRLFGLSDTLVLDSAIAFRARQTGMDQRAVFDRVIQELATSRQALIRKIKTYSDDLEPTDCVEFEHYLNSWLTLQRKVIAVSRQLRDKTRKAMKDHSQTLARLAELDATFDHAMAGYTGQCFSHIPKVLEQRFQSLAHDTSCTPYNGLHRYCEEAQNLLLAELDVRLEPVLGLLEACQNEVTNSP